MRIPRFHPLSDMPMFEGQRKLRGHAFYPTDRVLRTLAPRTPRLPADEAPCIVFVSTIGHMVLTEIDPKDLSGYGWTCLSAFPDGAEWGDVGYMGDIEKHRGSLASIWERDLHSNDANAAAAIKRILARYAPPPTVTVRGMDGVFVAEYSERPDAVLGPFDTDEMVQSLTSSGLLGPTAARTLVMNADVRGSASVRV
ncbi:hypothetical protein ABT024_05135 [Streptomyces sp. NPDC002812]|uniref:hypothetical protein n=1 Tax=Streptomyces sp. NPDC002812 TaxID=3154434 RepID=UPI00332914FE